MTSWVSPAGTVTKLLPELKRDEKVDFVVAQGENLSHGKGLEPSHVEAMMAAGVDAFTAGNWTLHREAIIPWLDHDAAHGVRSQAAVVQVDGNRYLLDVAEPGGPATTAARVGSGQKTWTGSRRSVPF